jgi:hypothetical protein
MSPRKLTRPLWVHKRQEHRLTAAFKGWPERPNWIVEQLAPGIDYYVIAGFPTFDEAIQYATRHASKEAV